MLHTYATYITTVANTIKSTQAELMASKIKETFDIDVSNKEPGYDLDPIILRQTWNCFNQMGVKLVNACGVKKLFISYTMGPNLPLYPNHGCYTNNTVTMNANVYTSPLNADDFFSSSGETINQADQTLVHELGHGFDEYQGSNNECLSDRPNWLTLSGWSKTYKSGLKQLIINDPGQPMVQGEMFYDPKAGFTRFYGKRNAWDDWADCFSFYVCGLPAKLPSNKQEYFKKTLAPYFAF